MRDLLDPKYGMFDISTETGYMWFKYGVIVFLKRIIIC